MIDPRIVETLLVAQRRREDSRLDTLTPREQEILGLIAEGWSNEAIAERLVITKRAVERHINSIFWKLDLGDSKDVSRRVKATLLWPTRSVSTDHFDVHTLSPAAWRAAMLTTRRCLASQRPPWSNVESAFSRSTINRSFSPCSVTSYARRRGWC